MQFLQKMVCRKLVRLYAALGTSVALKKSARTALGQGSCALLRYQRSAIRKPRFFMLKTLFDGVERQLRQTAANFLGGLSLVEVSAGGSGKRTHNLAHFALGGGAKIGNGFPTSATSSSPASCLGR